MWSNAKNKGPDELKSDGHHQVFQVYKYDEYMCNCRLKCDHDESMCLLSSQKYIDYFTRVLMASGAQETLKEKNTRKSSSTQIPISSLINLY